MPLPGLRKRRGCRRLSFELGTERGQPHSAFEYKSDFPARRISSSFINLSPGLTAGKRLLTPMGPDVSAVAGPLSFQSSIDLHN